MSPLLSPLSSLVLSPPWSRLLSRRVRSVSLLVGKLRRSLGTLALLAAMSPAAAWAAPPVIAPAGASVHVNGSQKFTVAWNGRPATTGLWYVLGGLQNGAIDQDGTFHAPYGIPSPSTVTIEYIFDGGASGTQTGVAHVTVTNPVPVISSVVPGSITQVSTPVLLLGDWFLPNSVVLINGQPTPTTYINQTRLMATADLSNYTANTVQIGVSNLAPGPSTTNVSVAVYLPRLRYVSPGTLASGGWVRMAIGGSNFTASTVALLDGRPMNTTVNSATSITAAAYLPSWRNQTSAVVGLAPQPGSAITSQQTHPVTAPALSYDTAARFATQAALGPRPGLVEHIQKIGLAGFVAEQLKQPGLAYSNPNVSPRMTLLAAAGTTNSLLRLRLAAAFNAFIPNQAIFLEYVSFQPWEKKLEADVTGNYRKLMTDIASDARLGSFLNLPGNHATADPALHPNQNFSREFLQLFTLGTVRLNDDGTTVLDSAGNPVPTYGQDTVLDLSRALTGWELPNPANPAFTAFQIDESRPLAAHDEFHDHGAKVLFGNVSMPSGQSTVQDRDMALDAIFAHPNLPPFLSRLLIGHLVTSNPSPAYVKRISAVFKDNGNGVRGDLAAVVTAILLDPEARAGDTAGAVNDGVLQDPMLWELFLFNILQQAPTDTQLLPITGQLGQDFWYPRSIFDFYPHSYAIPGTTINSPEWSLFNNVSAIHRSQYTYGFVAGQQGGVLGDAYMANSWLFTAFSNLPDLVDALNHMLYHGQMSAAEQRTILSYCAGLPDRKQQFVAAIFLALNADSYNVSH